MSKLDMHKTGGKKARAAHTLDDGPLSVQDNLSLRDRAMTWSTMQGKAGHSLSLDAGMGLGLGGAGSLGGSSTALAGGAGSNSGSSSNVASGGGSTVAGGAGGLFRKSASSGAAGSSGNLSGTDEGSAKGPVVSSPSFSRSSSMGSGLGGSMPRLFRSNSDRIKTVVAVDNHGSAPIAEGSLKRSGSERWRSKAGILRQRREQQDGANGADGGDASEVAATSTSAAEVQKEERVRTTNKLKQFWNQTIRRKKGKERGAEAAGSTGGLSAGAGASASGSAAASVAGSSAGISLGAGSLGAGAAAAASADLARGSKSEFFKSKKADNLWVSRFGEEEIQLTTVAMETLGPREIESLHTYALEQLSLMLAHAVPSAVSTPVPEEKRRGGFFQSFFKLGSSSSSSSGGGGGSGSGSGASKSQSSAAPPSPSLRSLAPRPASTGDAPKLFGIPLEQVLEEDRTRLKNARLRLPVVADVAIQFILQHGLRTPGIFRVSGSTRRVRQLNECFEARGEIKLDMTSPNDMASVLKYFLRSLPVPLLPSHLTTAFLDVTMLNTADEQLTAIRLLCALLPPTHRDLLQALLALLFRIAAHADEANSSMMSSRNLALVMAPNILRRDEPKGSSKLRGKAGLQYGMTEDADGNLLVQETDAVDVVELMIDYNEHLFVVPAEMRDSMLTFCAGANPASITAVFKELLEPRGRAAAGAGAGTGAGPTASSGIGGGANESGGSRGPPPITAVLGESASHLFYAPLATAAATAKLSPGGLGVAPALGGADGNDSVLTDSSPATALSASMVMSGPSSAASTPPPPSAASAGSGLGSGSLASAPTRESPVTSGKPSPVLDTRSAAGPAPGSKYSPTLRVAAELRGSAPLPPARGISVGADAQAASVPLPSPPTSLPSGTTAAAVNVSSSSGTGASTHSPAITFTAPTLTGSGAHKSSPLSSSSSGAALASSPLFAGDGSSASSSGELPAGLSASGGGGVGGDGASSSGRRTSTSSLASVSSSTYTAGGGVAASANSSTLSIGPATPSTAVSTSSLNTLASSSYATPTASAVSSAPNSASMATATSSPLAGGGKGASATFASAGTTSSTNAGAAPPPPVPNVPSLITTGSNPPSPTKSPSKTSNRDSPLMSVVDITSMTFRPPSSRHAISHSNSASPVPGTPPPSAPASRKSSSTHNEPTSPLVSLEPVAVMSPVIVTPAREQVAMAMPMRGVASVAQPALGSSPALASPSLHVSLARDMSAGEKISAASSTAEGSNVSVANTTSSNAGGQDLAPPPSPTLSRRSPPYPGPRSASRFAFPPTNTANPLSPSSSTRVSLSAAEAADALAAAITQLSTTVAVNNSGSSGHGLNSSFSSSNGASNSSAAANNSAPVAFAPIPAASSASSDTSSARGIPSLASVSIPPPASAASSRASADPTADLSSTLTSAVAVSSPLSFPRSPSLPPLPSSLSKVSVPFPVMRSASMAEEDDPWTPFVAQALAREVFALADMADTSWSPSPPPPTSELSKSVGAGGFGSTGGGGLSAAHSAAHYGSDTNLADPSQPATATSANISTGNSSLYNSRTSTTLAPPAPLHTFPLSSSTTDLSASVPSLPRSAGADPWSSPDTAAVDVAPEDGFVIDGMDDEGGTLV